MTKKVDSEGVNTLNAHPAIVYRYMFNFNYDVDGALTEIDETGEADAATGN